MNSSSPNITMSGNQTSQPQPSPGPPPIPPFLYRDPATITAQVIAFAILGIIILLGNLATIIIFTKTRSLRKKHNYMLINLAIADFLIAFVVFLNCYYFSKLPMFHPVELRKTLEVLDVFTGTSSLICLTLIAVERFHAIVFPFRHTSLSKKKYYAMCLMPWLLSAGIIFTLIGLDFPNQGIRYFNYLLFRYSILFVALAIIIIAYFVIWLKSPRVNPNNPVMRDKKLSVTLFIVTLASMLTWLPIQCFGFAFYVNNDLVGPHVNYFVALKYIQFINSAINFLIYVLRMRDFKAGFIALFCCNQNLRRQTDRLNSVNVSATTSVRELTSTSSITLNMTKQKSYVLSSGVNEGGLATSGQQQVEGITFKE